MFYPSSNEGDEILLRGLKYGQDLKMKRSAEAVPWLQNKYGENVHVFEGTVLMCNNDVKFDSKTKGPQAIKYQYILNKQGKKKSILERTSNMRSLAIQKVSDYTGQPEQLEGKDRSIFVVNGQAEIKDGNFLRPFKIQQLDRTGVYSGSYPSTADHMEQLAQKEITAVLCLQTQEDFKNTSTEWFDTLKLLKNSGILFAKNFQVYDTDEHEYHLSIFQACQYLNDMVNNKQQKVFIYCNTGISRAPTIIMAYLCLYKKVKEWQDTEAVAALLKLHLPGCQPNRIAI